MSDFVQRHCKSSILLNMKKNCTYCTSSLQLGIQQYWYVPWLWQREKSHDDLTFKYKGKDKGLKPHRERCNSSERPHIQNNGRRLGLNPIKCHVARVHRKAIYLSVTFTEYLKPSQTISASVHQFAVRKTCNWGVVLSSLFPLSSSKLPGIMNLSLFYLLLHTCRLLLSSFFVPHVSFPHLL